MSFINAKIATTEIREGKTDSGVTIDGLLIKDNGLTASGAVTVNADLVIDTDTFFVNSTNNYVGVGTNNPSCLLDVNGIIQSYSDSDNNSRLLLSQSTNSTDSPDLYIKKSRGTHSSKSAIQNNDILFDIIPYGYDGSSYINTSGIKYSIDGAVSTNTLPTKISFQTGETNSKSDRMTIKPNGYIGINTTSPDERLHIDGNLKITGEMIVSGNITTLETQTIENALTTIGAGQAGTPTYDIGHLYSRGTSNTIGLVWFENAKEFKTIYTQSDSTGTNVSLHTSDGISGYSDFHTATLKTEGNVIVKNRLSVGDDVLIQGNLTINGALNAITSNEIKLDDPVILFGNSQDGNTPTSNIGFIGSRGNSTNIGFIWNENDDEFKAIYTSSTANNNQATISTSDGNNGYAKLHIGSHLIENTLSVNGITTLTGALDANSTADIADTLTLSKSSGTGLAVTKNATIGGTLAVTGETTLTGDTTLTGALDANSTADIADTLTLSKSSGTGLAVTKNATIGGTLAVTGETTFNNTVTHNYTDELIIPKGNTSERGSTSGGIRYNTQLDIFEGRYNGAWNSLGGIRSTDGETTIDLTEATNDTMNFYIDDNSTPVVKLTASTLSISNTTIIASDLSIGGTVSFSTSQTIRSNCKNTTINNRKSLGTATSSGSDIETTLFNITLNSTTYNSVIGNTGGLKIKLIISDSDSKTTKFEEHYIQLRYRYDSSDIEHILSTCLIAFESNSNNNITIADTTLSSGTKTGGGGDDRVIPIKITMTPTYTGSNPTFYAYYTIEFTGSEGISITT